MKNVYRYAARSLLICLAVFSALIAYMAPNTYSGTDPRFSLLVSQQLLVEGSPRLTPFAAAYTADYRTFEQNGHLYYAYPPGPSLFSVPAVWVANHLGYDMQVEADDFAVQNMLSAVLCGVTVLLIYALSRRYVGEWASVGIAAVMMLSTLLISTMGTALWNVDYIVPLHLMTLWLITAYGRGQTHPTYPYLVGLTLFGSFLCRPTAAIFIVVILTFLFLRERPIFWPAAMTALILLLLWLGSNYLMMGQFLHPYYDFLDGSQTFNSQNGNTTPSWLVLYGLLFSPSRGLFIFCPVLLVALTVVIRYWKSLPQPWLVGAVLIWCGAHLLLLTHFDGWWGGAGFGSRLVAETLPGWTAVVIMGWYMAETFTSEIVIGAGFVAVVVGLYINSYAALFDPLTHRWNGGFLFPVHESSLMFDWRYPQFWVDEAALCARSRDYHRWYADTGRVVLPPYKWGMRIIASDAITSRFLKDSNWYPASDTAAPPTLPPTADSFVHQVYLPITTLTNTNQALALFGGWGVKPEEDLAYTLCDESIVLLGPMPQGDAAKEYGLSLTFLGCGEQTVTVWVNGELVGDFTAVEDELSTVQLTIPGRLLQTGQHNEVQLFTSNVAWPFDDVQRQGVGFRLLTIEPSQMSR